MTALAALIDSVENPTRIRWNGQEVFSTESALFDPFFEGEIPLYSISAWSNRVASKVQANQEANGIPVRTIQEAIDAGEFSQ